MTTLLLADDKSGLLQTAPPWLLVVGGFIAVILGVILVMVAAKMNEENTAHDVLMWVSWVVIVIGVVGIAAGFFGPSILDE